MLLPPRDPSAARHRPIPVFLDAGGRGLCEVCGRPVHRYSVRVPAWLDPWYRHARARRPRVDKGAIPGGLL